MNKWQSVWNNTDRVQHDLLYIMLRLDGFNTGTGTFEIENWLEYTNELYKHLNLSKDSNVFEVGCGSGAFLYPLEMKGFYTSGIDYAKELVELGNKFSKYSSFITNDAIYLDTKHKYTNVISHSVFNYFHSLQYAEQVLMKMIDKSTDTIALFDLNDISKFEKSILLRSADFDSLEQYEEHYKGLEQLQFDKQWFMDFARLNNLKIKIFDQTYTIYENSQYRFNVILTRS